MRFERPQDALTDAPAIAHRLYGARAEAGSLSAIAPQMLVVLSETPDERVDDMADMLAVDVSTISHALRALSVHQLIE